MLNRAVSAIRKGITKKSSKSSAKQSNASDDDENESIIACASVESSLSALGSVSAAPVTIAPLNSIEGDYYETSLFFLMLIISLY